MSFFSSSKSRTPISFSSNALSMAALDLQSELDAVEATRELAYEFVKQRCEALDVIIENGNISKEMIESHDACLVDRHNEIDGDIDSEQSAIEAIQADINQYGDSMDTAKLQRLHSQQQQYAKNIESLRGDQERLQACQRRLVEKAREVDRYQKDAISYKEKFTRAWERFDRQCHRISSTLSSCSACLDQAQVCARRAADALAQASARVGEDATWNGDHITITNLRPFYEAAQQLYENADAMLREAQSLIDAHREKNSYLQDPIMESMTPAVFELHTRYHRIAKDMQHHAKALENAAEHFKRYLAVPRGLST